jgi:Maltokinase N-terminal cap domain
MAIIHKTTLTPTKLELLAGWLPAQPWYLHPGRAPELAKAGGFRLDDPDGEVGIEFMVVTDGSGDQAVSYLVPMTYRAAALGDADGALIGTTEHGVLGRRWVYDGLADPVLVGQLVALVHGRAEPQMQSVNDTADPTVTCVPVTDGGAPLIVAAAAFDYDVAVGTVRVPATGGRLVITVDRVLTPDDADDAPGRLFAGWRLPDGTTVRGCLATATYGPAES